MALHPGKTRPGIQHSPAAKRIAAKPAARSPIRRAPDPRLTHLRKLAVDWKAELEQCLQESGVETVHRIRTGTRRVEAMIDVFVQEAPDGNPDFTGAATRWRQQLKRIRRAAAPVRDLDVHRKLLEKYATSKTVEAEPGTLSQSSEIEGLPVIPDESKPIQAQADKLDAWLKHAREHNAAELIRQIKKRLERLDGLAAEFTEAWASIRGRRKPVRDAARVSLDIFVGLSDRMPLLDSANLHEFRIGAKKARYVTEVSGSGPQAAAIGKAIKRVQDVIGDWHDWLCLADEAHIALGDEGTQLTELLEAEVERSFQLAKRITERMRGRLAGEWQALRRK
jgi:CHAD domain-containing protein